jgi:hypothetical protein
LQRANDAGDDLGGGGQRGVALPLMLPSVFSGTSNSARPLYIPAAMMEKDAEEARGAVPKTGAKVINNPDYRNRHLA